MTTHFDGRKNEVRIELARQGTLVLGTGDYPVRPFRKTTLTYAVRLPYPFTVATLEGLNTGKAGDWLAVGAHGEMYPIDDAVFTATYQPATAHDEEKHG